MEACGKQTEVYSRVTGYFRPLKNWNAGKQEEFRNRRIFVVSEDRTAFSDNDDTEPCVAAGAVGTETHTCACS